MNNYLLVDVSNLFHRAKHMAHKHSTLEDKLGMSLHLSMGCVAKPWREQKATHVVFCFEGRSWRKSFYAPYKANRAVARAALTEKEQEEEQMFWDVYAEMQSFLFDKTNCTCLQHPQLEADDLIAGWIQSHPNDKHCIVSSDTDFYQLISNNVIQYNGITDETITLQGFFDKKGNPVIDKKTKQAKQLGDPKYILFEKCMRGDPSDNVFSAYPGVRSKGTKNKVGLIDAYADKDTKGFNWNNLMLQRWSDPDGVEHKVLDDYNRNVTLVDLTAQPDEIKELIAETIANGMQHKQKPMVGAQFMKFCGKHQLIRLSDQSTQFAEIFSAGYPDYETV